MGGSLMVENGFITVANVWLILAFSKTACRTGSLWPGVFSKVFRLSLVLYLSVLLDTKRRGRRRQALYYFLSGGIAVIVVSLGGTLVLYLEIRSEKCTRGFLFHRVLVGMLYLSRIGCRNAPVNYLDHALYPPLAGARLQLEVCGTMKFLRLLWSTLLPVLHPLSTRKDASARARMYAVGATTGDQIPSRTRRSTQSAADSLPISAAGLGPTGFAER